MKPVKRSNPSHCKGCLSLTYTKAEKAWCCTKGAPAKDSTGWCALLGRKTVRGEKYEQDKPKSNLL